MKKIMVTILVLELLMFINPEVFLNNISIAKTSSSKSTSIDKTNQNTNDTNEIINNQKQNLNIDSFIKESQKYTKESMPELDLNNLLSSAIKGGLDNVKLSRVLLRLLGKEIMNAAVMLSSIIAIIVIHSILKAISDGLGNSSVSPVAYYVQ